MGNVKSFCCKDNVSEIDDREERSRILNDQCGNSCEDLYNNSNTSALSNNQDSISYGSINNGNSSKTIEQSALDKIYQKMAANVIDVAPGESMVIQQAEFIERQKAYQAKLNQIKTPLPLSLTNRVASKHVSSSFDTNNTTTTLSNNNSNFNFGGANNSSMMGNNFNLLHQNNHSHHNHLTPANTNNNSTNNSGNSPQHVGKSQEKRRVEYEPISRDEIQLINDISLKSAQAIKSLKIIPYEQVVAQFKP